MKGSKKGFYDSLKVGLSEEEQAKKAEEIKKKIASHKYKGGSIELDEEEKEEYNLVDYLYMVINKIALVPSGLKREDIIKYAICPENSEEIKIKRENMIDFEENWKKLSKDKYDELMRQEDD